MNMPAFLPMSWISFSWARFISWYSSTRRYLICLRACGFSSRFSTARLTIRSKVRRLFSFNLDLYMLSFSRNSGEFSWRTSSLIRSPSTTFTVSRKFLQFRI